ncbi:7404_t:CDS:2 [Ambispora gerdemannii]|uniref:7404_t:CDS:1 n=1 Tax=Ambispora gerdemannii TaxID=144530 RepID=A0A9N8V3K2_9GLOM|nr:7404_t:CDS:2 [Ambispora gerdemannii]
MSTSVKTELIYEEQPYSEVENDVDEKRLVALYQIDTINFSWFHIRTCIVAGIGFFTDAYDLFVINLVSTMLGVTYFSNGTNHSVPSTIDLGLKVSAAVGTLFGQLIFGVLADRYGRKQACPLSGTSYTISVHGSITIWRFFLGIGIGGDYPMSAVITSEFATTARRGAMMAAVFAMQGFGILSAGVFSVLILSIYKTSIQDDKQNVDYVWRIVTIIGIIPAFIGLYFRLTIPESPRYTMDIEGNIGRAANDIQFVTRKSSIVEEYQDDPRLFAKPPPHNWENFKAYFGQWKNAKVLIGTSVSWFVLDIAFYGIGLNNGIILNAIGFATSDDPFKILWNVAVGNIIITMLGTVPGYWFTVFLIDTLGRKFIQLMGFAILTVIFIVLGFGYNVLKEQSPTFFIILFSAAQFFQNFGPNSTTFIVPGEVFPTRYRSTGHGIAAASGKFGAIIGQVGFLKLKDRGGPNKWVDRLILIFAAFMFTGFLFTFLIPETKGKTLEELSNEEQKNFLKGKKRKDESEEEHNEVIMMYKPRQMKKHYEHDDDDYENENNRNHHKTAIVEKSPVSTNTTETHVTEEQRTSNLKSRNYNNKPPISTKLHILTD